MSIMDAARPVWEVECTPEYSFGMDGTKWQIFCCSIHYFAEYDYSSMSMRHLAGEVGIRASSIYNHFASKEDILLTMYEYMRHFMNIFEPNLDDLLADVDSLPPRAVFNKTFYRYPPPMQQLMSKMILICSKLMRSDSRADEILTRFLIGNTKHYCEALLKKMVACNRIKPLNINAFAELYTNNFYGAAMRMYSSHPVDPDIWDQSFALLFDLIHPIEQD